mmetsp:Transcript_7624/g.13815  ORF Transcript_7624/g.13815 Transcript_7624/m.13815 type:complete len:236 (+) Transcript_7624:280-987(+)
MDRQWQENFLDHFQDRGRIHYLARNNCLGSPRIRTFQMFLPMTQICKQTDPSTPFNPPQFLRMIRCHLQVKPSIPVVSKMQATILMEVVTISSLLKCGAHLFRHLPTLPISPALLLMILRRNFRGTRKLRRLPRSFAVRHSKRSRKAFVRLLIMLEVLVALEVAKQQLVTVLQMKRILVKIKLMEKERNERDVREGGQQVAKSWLSHAPLSGAVVMSVVKRKLLDHGRAGVKGFR